jgi:hypothetical protein
VLDILISYVGVIPDGPALAFQRYRYRVRPKTNIPGPFDPSFWLVHYSTAEEQYQQVIRRGYQLRPESIQILNERRILQSQGLIQRKDFMLVDRSSWPQVHYPAMNQGRPPPYPGRPGPGPHTPGQPPFAYPGPNAHAAGPPAKRARQTGPAQIQGAMPVPPVALYHDTELELLEDTSSGDYLDNISPATISRDRFKRHHLWLEEVFSSLYSPGQILAEDLGFGLVGELGELTKGILGKPERKNTTEQERKDPMAFYQDPQINASVVYKHLDSDKFAEFEKRVASFVDARNQEMDDMREKHAKIMSRVNKGKIYVDAEERLREAGLDSDKIEEIVREVELKMGISLQERHDVVCIQRGGLEDEEKAVGVNGVSPDKEQTNGHVAADDGTTGLLNEFTTSNGNGALATAEQSAPAPGAGLDLTDGMDLDVPAAAITTDASTAVPASVPEQVKAVDTTPAPIFQAETLSQQTSVPPASEPVVDTSLTTADLATDVAGISDTPDDVMEGEPESMFDEADFSAFDGIEGDFAAGGDDDGLLDFGDGFGGATGTTPTGGS